MTATVSLNCRFRRVDETVYLPIRVGIIRVGPALTSKDRDAAKRRPNAIFPSVGTPSQKEYACVAGCSVQTCVFHISLNFGTLHAP